MTEWESTKRGAKNFAKDVDPNKTYYTIHTAVYPWGEEKLWRPWKFDQKKWPMSGWWSGAVSAEGACLRYGPMYDTRPGSHIRPMFACDDDALYAEPADIIKILASRERERARR
ncbi:hypothetical protein [Streptomyces lydicus]|uniref:hypothetical protein n=1 Tax=Streptomyces lydicus TaxID=47763 RepID=UPI0036E02ABC